MKSERHVEIRFLIKAFARYCSEADAIMKFQMQYGKEPTRYQLANADRGKWLNDKRPMFRDHHLTRMFRDERDKYEASKENLPIASQAWRMEQYQHIYNRSMRKAQETGNFSRNLDILTLAAKDSAGFYNPKVQNVQIDNRTQVMNMSDEEINRKFRALAQQFNQFNIHIPDIPLINHGDKVIEYEGDDSEVED